MSMKPETINDQRIVCFDNEGATFDRYTVIYLDQPENHKPGIYNSVGMSERPFHPQGFGQHMPCMFPVRGIGKRVKFASLPDDCRRLVERDLS